MEARSNANQAQTDARKCIAYDCPLCGTCSGSINSSSSWTCKYHYETKSSNWTALTLFINNNFDLYQAYVKLLRMPVPDWPDNRKLWAKASVPPKPDEDIFTYRRRVLNYFETKIKV